MTSPDGPLAPRDLLVLAALSRGPAHGYGIIRTVEAESKSGVLLDPGNLYRVLKRMRRDGWVEEAPDATPTPPPDSGTAGDGDGDGRAAGAGGGPPRRVYRLTPAGRTALVAELERLERLVSRTWPALGDGPAEAGEAGAAVGPG